MPIVATERPATDRVGTDGSVLRFFNPETGRNLLTPTEVEAGLREAEAKWREDGTGRRQIEAELAVIDAWTDVP